MNYGDIYFVNFDKSIGHEYMGLRPAVIIQSNHQLKITNTITIMPLTSKIDKCHSDDVIIKKNDRNRLISDSLIKVHQIKSFDPSRFTKKIGIADDEILEKIKEYLKKHFGI